MDQSKKKVFIGFDFSINKPAATLMHDGQYDFFIWPLDMKPEVKEKFEKYGVNVYARGLSHVEVKKMTSSELAYLHTKRSTDLANLITFSLTHYLISLGLLDREIWISSEGLSMASKGNQALNLATYKGVLLSKLYESFEGLHLETYSPITIKSIAGCASKEKRSKKEFMIEAFLDEGIDHPMLRGMRLGEFTKKKNYYDCIDDIVDSYFALKTMLVKTEQN